MTTPLPPHPLSRSLGLSRRRPRITARGMAPATRRRRRRLVRRVGLALCVLLLAAPVGRALRPEATAWAKGQLKSTLEDADPDCGVAAAMIDEQHGRERAATALRLAVALPTGRCAMIPGSLAIAAGRDGPLEDAPAPDGPTPDGATVDIADGPTPDGATADVADGPAVHPGQGNRAPSGPSDQERQGGASTDATRPADASAPDGTGPAPTRPASSEPAAAPMGFGVGDAGLARVTLAVPRDITAGAADIGSARRFVAGLRRDDLGEVLTVDTATGLQRRELTLPPAGAANTWVLDVLGLRLPTLANDLMPSGTLAIQVAPPAGSQGALGPFVWSRTPIDALGMFGTPMEANFAAERYPERLLAEVLLNVEAPDGARFLPTDRVGDFTGAELASGAVSHGTAYLCTPPSGAWRLYEYPALPAQGDCVHLMWPFNPTVEDTPGHRLFGPPPWLVKEQTAHQVITVEALERGEDAPRNIGPSVLFRTDPTDPEGRTDLLVFAPFLYLDNVALLGDLALRLPFADGTVADPDQLIVAAGDLHYVSFGELRPLLDGGYRLREVEPSPAGAVPLDFARRTNRVAFYLGLPAGRESP